MRVMKFGGTSVGNAARFQQVADLIALHRASDPRLVVVVSAMAGVTDALIRMSHQAARGEPDWIPALAALWERHQDTVRALGLPEEEAHALEAELREGFERVETVLRAVEALKELSPSTADLLAGMGERWSARIMAAVLRARSIPARAVDADAFLITDDRFGEASPDLEQTRARARALLTPLLEQGILPMVTGFIGATPEGRPTTLGRGGSDFSATILGYALDAEEVWIWTDVDGVMSADPKIVPGARTIPELSYIEAAEMAYFGAKVLHPRTLLQIRGSFSEAIIGDQERIRIHSACRAAPGPQNGRHDAGAPALPHPGQQICRRRRQLHPRLHGPAHGLHPLTPLPALCLQRVRLLHRQDERPGGCPGSCLR